MCVPFILISTSKLNFVESRINWSHVAQVDFSSRRMYNLQLKAFYSKICSLLCIHKIHFDNLLCLNNSILRYVCLKWPIIARREVSAQSQRAH